MIEKCPKYNMRFSDTDHLSFRLSFDIPALLCVQVCGALGSIIIKTHRTQIRVLERLSKSNVDPFYLKKFLSDI